MNIFADTKPIVFFECLPIQCLQIILVAKKQTGQQQISLTYFSYYAPWQTDLLLYLLYFKMLLGDKRAKPRISMDGVYAEQRHSYMDVTY